MDISLVLLLTGVAFGFVGSLPAAGPGTALLIRLSSRASRSTLVGAALGCALGEGAYVLASTSTFAWILEHYPFARPAIATMGFLVLAVCGAKCLALALSRSDSSTSKAEAVTTDETRSRRKLPALAAFGIGLAVAVANPLPLFSWSTHYASVLSLLEVQPTFGARTAFAWGATLGVFGWLTLLGTLAARSSRRWGPAFDRWMMRGTTAAVFSAAAAVALGTVEG